MATPNRTGKFEVEIVETKTQLFSKLQTQRFPNAEDIKQMSAVIDKQMK